MNKSLLMTSIILAVGYAAADFWSTLDESTDDVYNLIEGSVIETPQQGKNGIFGGAMNQSTIIIPDVPAKPSSEQGDWVSDGVIQVDLFEAASFDMGDAETVADSAVDKILHVAVKKCGGERAWNAALARWKKKNFVTPHKLRTRLGAFVECYDAINVLQDTIELKEYAGIAIANFVSGKSYDDTIDDFVEAGAINGDGYGSMAATYAIMAVGIAKGESIADAAINTMALKAESGELSLYEKLGINAGEFVANISIFVDEALNAKERRRVNERAIKSLKEAGYDDDVVNAYREWLSLPLNVRAKNLFNAERVKERIEAEREKRRQEELADQRAYEELERGRMRREEREARKRAKEFDDDRDEIQDEIKRRAANPETAGDVKDKIEEFEMAVFFVAMNHSGKWSKWEPGKAKAMETDIKKLNMIYEGYSTVFGESFTSSKKVISAKKDLEDLEKDYAAKKKQFGK